MVKNVFELYPGGYERAVSEFDTAWEWAVETYRFSSLADYAAGRNSPIIDKDVLGGLFPSPSDFREYAKQAVLSRTTESLDEFRRLVLE